MHPLSDKDLDRLSREAAEQNDVPMRPSGWDQLEKRLEKVLPIKKEKDRRRFFWIFFLFLLAGGSGLIWIVAGKKNASTINSIAGTIENNSPSTTTDKKEDNNSSSINNTKTKQKVQAIKDIDTENKTIAAQKNNIPANNSAPDAATVQSNSLPIVPVPNNISAKNNFADTKKGKQLIAAVTPGRKRKYTADIIKDQQVSNPIYRDKQDPSVVSNKTGDKDNTQQKKPAIIPATPDTNTIAAANDPIIKNEKNAVPATSVPPVTKPAVAAKVEKKKPAKGTAFDRLAIGIFTGMDLSRINGTGNSKPGFDLGLQVSYNFSRRLSVSTGFMATKKNYSAAGKDFHPPLHYWTTYVHLVNLNGNCNMWDIPLNLRYNISIKPTSTWFASAGISSYIMRKQAYSYNYKPNISSTTILTKDWKTSSQQNEWMNVVNVSAGFEKKLNRSWSLQTEPFIKLPISGMGFGNMNISSYGILVGIKYWPQFISNKTTPARKNP